MKPVVLSAVRLGSLAVCVAFATAMATAAEPPSQAFFKSHCYECHDADSHEGGLDLSALKLDLADAANFRPTSL